MTLFNDSLDWDADPSTGMETTFYTADILGPSQLIGTHPLTGFDHAVLLWNVAGGGTDEMTLRVRGEWLTSAGTEFTDTVFYRDNFTSLIVPLAGLGQFVNIYGEFGDTYPFHVNYSIAYRNGQILNTMMLGEPHQMSYHQPLGPTSDDLYRPNVYIPGRHQIWFATDGTDYTVDLSYLWNPFGWFHQRIGSNTAPLVGPFEFVAPPGAWGITVTNNAAGAIDIDLYATMSPTLI